MGTPYKREPERGVFHIHGPQYDYYYGILRIRPERIRLPLLDFPARFVANRVRILAERDAGWRRQRAGWGQAVWQQVFVLLARL